MSVRETAAPGSRASRREDVRAKVMAYLSQQAQGRGHVVTTTKALAEAVGLPPATVAYTVRRLVADGMLSTKSLGPRGQRFVIERTEPLKVRRRGRAAKAGQYCPWCGKPVEAAWRYCVHCGQSLPRGKA
jgi:predicted transcriptional regulator